ncbi:MAG: Rrf2 family transcriptional regulator [Firmicutes bacterium]|nr:Rrf2 family transcriptional regulator [Bacillota bacterium]
MHISTKCSIAIHCLIYISEYGESQKVTSNLLSLSTGSNPVTIRNIISSLKKEGILSVKFGTGGTMLSCPLEKITLYRICSALEPDFLNKLIGIHVAPSPLCPVGKNIHSVLDASYARIQNDLQVSLQSVSMKEIMDNYHKLYK